MLRPVTGLEVGPETTEATGLKDRVAVAEPHLDLRQLELGVGMSLSANVPSAPPTGRLGGPFRPGDAARHLTVLGALALVHVLGEDGRSYVLPRQVHYVGIDGLTGSSPGGAHWRVEATAVADAARQGRAFTRLRGPGGRPAVVLAVDYAVVPERVFIRRHTDRVRVDSAFSVATELPSGDRTAMGDGLRVEIAEVPASACSGHFPGVPAASVAVLLGRLTELAGDIVLAGMAPGVDAACYTIDEAEVWADELVFAGQDLSFEVELADHAPGSRWVRGRILSGGRVVAGCRMRVGVWLRNGALRSPLPLASSTG